MAPKWTSTEDFNLHVAVHRFGEHCWKHVAAFLKTGRTHHACFHRWVTKFKPQPALPAATSTTTTATTTTTTALFGNMQKKWTTEEYFDVYIAVERFGENNWAAVSRYLGTDRTPAACKIQWALKFKKTEKKERFPEPKVVSHIPSSVAPRVATYPRAARVVRSFAEDDGEAVKRVRIAPPVVVGSDNEWSMCIDSY